MEIISEIHAPIEKKTCATRFSKFPNHRINLEIKQFFSFVILL